METKTTLTLVGFVVALFGYIAVHRLTDWRNKRTEIRAAIATYKSAFAIEISAVKNGAIGLDTFPDSFDRHKKAVDDIRSILSPKDQSILQKAWDEYRGRNKGYGLLDKDFVSGSASSIYFEDRKESKEFLERFHYLHSCLNHLI